MKCTAATKLSYEECLKRLDYFTTFKRGSYLKGIVHHYSENGFRNGYYKKHSNYYIFGRNIYAISKEYIDSVAKPLQVTRDSKRRLIAKLKAISAHFKDLQRLESFY